MERCKGLVLRQFLASDLTVHDLMHRLGKKRPDQIYRMMFVINKKEARTGFFMDKFERGLECFIDVTMDKVERRFTHNDLCALTDRLETGGTLTESDQPIIDAFLTDPKMSWPTEWSMVSYRIEKERACSTPA